jgi:hypothetical protein
MTEKQLTMFMAEEGLQTLVYVSFRPGGLPQYVVKNWQTFMTTPPEIISTRKEDDVTANKVIHHPKLPQRSELPTKPALYVFDYCDSDDISNYLMLAARQAYVVLVIPDKEEEAKVVARHGLVRVEGASTDLYRLPAAYPVWPGGQTFSARQMPNRPLRSVLVGDTHYNSLYIQGVAEGMTRLGHWHKTIDIRTPADELDSLVSTLQPDIVWTHMLLGPPAGTLSTLKYLDLCAKWRTAGALVILQDGDPRTEPRYPADLSASVDAALLNHKQDWSPNWNIPCHRWTYAAFHYNKPPGGTEHFKAPVAFHGVTNRKHKIYAGRSEFLEAAGARELVRVFGPSRAEDPQNTLARHGEAAADAEAVLGFGIPEIPGWIDSRIFLYPGAGGVLIHDDASEFLTAGEHYLKCERFSVDSLSDCLLEARARGPEIRKAAFEFIQKNHTWEHRVAEALSVLFHE